MKKTKVSIMFILNIIYMVITGAVNVYGYFHLPTKMATQISLSGDQVNMMPKSVYLIISFAAVLFLSLFGLKKEKEQKIKFFAIASLIFVANILMIVTQLS